MATEPNLSLNDFSDHLLLHILSFLPTLDAIRTASVCRKWHSLLPSLSSLNFDFSLFPPAATPAETRRLFAESVDLYLLRRPHSPLLKLRFQFNFREDLYSFHIDSWIRYAVNHGVAEIDVDFYINRDYQVSDTEEFNECLFVFYLNSVRDSRVRVLKFCRCELIFPVDLPASLSFKSIQSLYLDQIYLTDDMVSDLILGCPNLESLSLESCYCMEELKIRSSKLKWLSLVDFYSQNQEEESVEICVPNLRSICIICFEMGMYSLKEMTSLVEAHVEFMHEEKHYKYWSKVVPLISGVKHLVVGNWWFRAVVSKDCLPQSFVFNNLSHLKLHTAYTKADLLGIAVLLERSPNLGTMILDCDHRIDEEVFGDSVSEEFESINFNLPSLRQLKLNVYWGSMEQLHFLRLVLKSEVVLEKIVLRSVRKLVVPIVLAKQSRGFKLFRDPSLVVASMFIKDWKRKGNILFDLEVRNLFTVAIVHMIITFRCVSACNFL